MEKLKEIVTRLEKTMRCNCDLDNWEPEKNTGHSVEENFSKLNNAEVL